MKLDLGTPYYFSRNPYLHRVMEFFTAYVREDFLSVLGGVMPLIGFEAHSKGS